MGTIVLCGIHYKTLSGSKHERKKSHMQTQKQTLNINGPWRSISTKRRQRTLKYYNDSDAKMGIEPNLVSDASAWHFVTLTFCGTRP